MHEDVFNSVNLLASVLTTARHDALINLRFKLQLFAAEESLIPPLVCSQ